MLTSLSENTWSTFFTGSFPSTSIVKNTHLNHMTLSWGRHFTTFTSIVISDLSQKNLNSYKVGASYIFFHNTNTVIYKTNRRTKTSYLDSPCHWHEDVWKKKPPVPVSCIRENCHQKANQDSIIAIKTRCDSTSEDNIINRNQSFRTPECTIKQVK